MAEIRENGRLHVTRREFLLGSAGVAVAAIGTTMIVSGCSSEENEGIVPGELEVSESQVVQSSDFTELETDDCIEQTAAFELPMGSVGTMSCAAASVERGDPSPARVDASASRHQRTAMASPPSIMPPPVTGRLPNRAKSLRGYMM